MNHFKFALKTTGIALLVALALGLAGSTWIYFQKVSDRIKMERTALLGSGLGIATCLVIAPVWLIAAGKVGQERQAAREAKKREKIRS